MSSRTARHDLIIHANHNARTAAVCASHALAPHSQPTVTQPHGFQRSDNRVPQITLTPPQLAGGNLTKMSSAVMSWLNGVGEMATYKVHVWHAAGVSRSLRPQNTPK